MGPIPVHRISPIQALAQFFPQASEGWLESVAQEHPHCARDIMHGGVVTVTLDTTVEELVELLTEKEISGVPVLSPQGQTVGVVSLTDVAAYVGQSWVRNQGAGPSPEGQVARTLVSEIMSPFVYFVEENASLEHLAEVMLEHHIHRVLVLQDEQTVGIVSSLDLIRALTRRGF